MNISNKNTELLFHQKQQNAATDVSCRLEDMTGGSTWRMEYWSAAEIRRLPAFCTWNTGPGHHVHHSTGKQPLWSTPSSASLATWQLRFQPVIVKPLIKSTLYIDTKFRNSTKTN